MAYSGGRIIVQHDWHECLKVANEKFWVMLKQIDSKSLIADITVNSCVAGENLSTLVSSSDEFEAVQASDDSITVTYKKRDNQTRIVSNFVRPERVFTELHKPKKRVACIDVTNGGLGVSSDDDGNLLVWEASDGQLRRRLVGSIGDVCIAKFYPSGVVVLSGGADLRLRIWSAETGQCAATLVGHTEAVHDCGFVDRGRNVLSVSKDGSMRLWNCGTARELARINCESGALNACAIQHSESARNWTSKVEDNDMQIDRQTQESIERTEVECGTQHKLVAVACESHVCLVYDLYERRLLRRLPSTLAAASLHDSLQGERKVEVKASSVTRCAFLHDQLVVFGCESSRIVVADLADCEHAIFTYEMPSRSGVNAILPLNAKVPDDALRRLAFLVAFNDGSCVLFVSNTSYVRQANTRSISFSTAFELTGSDCDALYGVACMLDRTDVLLYTACRDGAIRKYRISLYAIEQFAAVC